MGRSALFSTASARSCSYLVAAAAALLCMAPCPLSVGQQLRGMQWAGVRPQVGMPARACSMLQCGLAVALCFWSTLCTTTCAASLFTVALWAATASTATPSGALLKPLHRLKPLCSCILAAGLLGACWPPLGWYLCAYAAPMLSSLLRLNTAAAHVKPLQGRCWML